MQIRLNIAASTVDSLSLPSLPDGYEVRLVRDGDESMLVDLLSSAETPEWVGNFDTPTMMRYLELPDRRQGSYVVAFGNELVACCFATRWDDGSVAWGLLDYVCSSPGHRRKGLGFAVCTAVMKYFGSAGYGTATLTTLGVTEHNHRHAAIKLYLRLGMLPMRTEDNAEACHEIYSELGWPLPVRWWDGSQPPATPVPYM